MQRTVVEDIHSKNLYIPRGFKIAAAGMIAITLFSAAMARITGQGPTVPVGEPVEVRSLLFDAQPDGSMVVKDHETGAEVALLAPNRDGFIRVVLIGLHRERTVQRVEGEEVYDLVLWDDGRMSLDDPLTGQRIIVSNHGGGLTASFAQLFETREDNG